MNDKFYIFKKDVYPQSIYQLFSLKTVIKGINKKRVRGGKHTAHPRIKKNISLNFDGTTLDVKDFSKLIYFIELFLYIFKLNISLL